MTQPEIRRNDSLNRFEAHFGGNIALLTFKMAAGEITFVHTEVPPEFQGQGIGSTLARAALDFAKLRGLTVCAAVPLRRFLYPGSP